MDKVIESVGEFGRYQRVLTFFLGLISSLAAMTIYSTVFTAASPELLCYHKASPEVLSNSCDAWNSLDKDNETECKFDNTYYEKTLVTEYELICDKSFLVGLTQTIYMVGTICGLFIGYFSDKYGRKRVGLVLSILLSFVLVISELVQIFNINWMIKYVIYCIGQFMIGALAKALYLVIYILLIEITTSKYSTMVSNLYLYMYVVGEIFVLVFAYFFRNWHILSWAISGYSIIMIFIIVFLVPESPRYLATKNRIEECKAVLKSIAEKNKKTLTNEENLFIKNTIESCSDIKLDKIDTESQKEETKKKKSNLSHLWKPRKNLFQTLMFVFLWFALSLIYYGVSLGITNLDQDINPYLMYLISSIAEIVGYATCHLNDKFGRKKMFIFFLISSSIVCLIVALLPSSSSDAKSETITLNSILKILFASAGKAMASAAFNSCYIYNSMLYPTNVRSTVVLFASNVGRIGSFISPQINLLQTQVWKPLPYIIFSSASFMGAVFVFLLPDPDKTKFM